LHYLISGSSGFLGGTLKRRLQELDHKVSVINHLEILNYESSPSIQHFIEDRSPDVFVHAAWNVNPVNWRKTESQKEFTDSSVKFIKGLARNGLKEVIGIGSCLEYLPSRQKLIEESPISEENTYIRDKHSMRKSLFKLSEDFDLKVNWARIFNLYGPGDNSKRLIPSLLNSNKEKNYFFLKNENQPINYLHVEDAANALIKIVDSEVKSKSIFNISGEILLTPRLFKNALEQNNFDFIDNFDQIIGKSTSDFYWGNNEKIKTIGWQPKKNFGNEIRNLKNAI
jgi:dTDP-6-deoxy-L-talose 4-dehydrogenase (NAD+)